MSSIFSEFSAAQKLTRKRYNVIFYSESRFYLQYFQPLFEDLIGKGDLSICYITSDQKDPVLKDARIDSFYIKFTIGGVFSKLQADVVIMTMPDLNNYIIKKSKAVKKYIYIFHALVSTHQQYKKHAFDHFDTIFCTGPQQKEEIRAHEALHKLPAKELIDYGYPLLNYLKEIISPLSKGKVLIAPSWYKEGILHNEIFTIIEVLLKQGFKVVLRPHPEFIKRNQKKLKKIKEASEKFQFTLDESPVVYTHLNDAEFLITDRSGICFEYAFACRRPVIFIDSPLKIENPDWQEIGLIPVENHYRGMIGLSVKPGEINFLPQVIEKIQLQMEAYTAQIKETENSIVYPFSNYQKGLEYLRQLSVS